MAPLTICVTGGTGFIGRHFTQRVERENVNARILTRHEKDLTSDDQLSYFQGDLLDRNSLRSFVEPGSVVVHLAYLPAKSFGENLQALENLTNICREKKILRFVHVSTAIVAGVV